MNPASFRLVSPFTPGGDQGAAIADLVANFRAGKKRQTLLGITGSGKTFSIAAVIAALNLPTLVISHNKTLAAQLYAEFKAFFPHNAVEYFVSYYDYYQPEAYLPGTDTYIEKDAAINAEIERLRLAATSALMARRDVVVVSSVSCLYGLGSPDEYLKGAVTLSVGQSLPLDAALKKLVKARYARNPVEFARGMFRVRGDTLDVYPAYGLDAIRVEFGGETIERLAFFHPTTGQVIRTVENIAIFPAIHHVAGDERIERALASIRAELAGRLAELRRDGKELYAQRLEERVNHDLEMIRELGYCSGIENYSRHFDQRPPGAPPSVLMDYFPKEFLVIVDESHVTTAQIRAMYAGDRSRKEALVSYGFRLPSAYDNRPLTFDEWHRKVDRVVYLSATPAAWEVQESEAVVEQVIRPTGLLDPEIIVRPVKGEVDDLVGEVRTLAARRERVLALTLTKKMAEDLSAYLLNLGLKAEYLHAGVTTLDRLAVLQRLRTGEIDVLVGVNLLREGLDLPEVSLMAILDADQEGFLRSVTSLIQMAGRAARHLNGRVIMYADRVTDSMREAIAITNRRRALQRAHNEKYGITPQTIVRNAALLEHLLPVVPSDRKPDRQAEYEKMDRNRLYLEMVAAAQNLEFERAAQLRDLIYALETGEIEETDEKRGPKSDS